MIIEHQGRTFNRTGRQKIHLEHISATLDEDNHRLEIAKLDGADWLNNIDDSVREKSTVHFDVASRLFNRRKSAGGLKEVVTPNWPGLTVSLPEEFRHGVYGVRLQVVVSISEGTDAGLVVARSARMTIAPGQGSSESTGSSSLRCVPHGDVRSEMWELILDDPEGPIIHLNTAFEQEDWRDFIKEPQFKFGILPGLLRDIFFDIVMHQESPKGWAKTWMHYPGAASMRESMPTLDDGDNVQDIVSEARSWAQKTARAFSARNRVFDAFEKARRDAIGQE